MCDLHLEKVGNTDSPPGTEPSVHHSAFQSLPLFFFWEKKNVSEGVKVRFGEQTRTGTWPRRHRGTAMRERVERGNQPWAETNNAKDTHDDVGFPRRDACASSAAGGRGGGAGRRRSGGWGRPDRGRCGGGGS